MFPDLEQKDEAANSDSCFITEDLVKKILKELTAWKSQNTESLGQLWLDLFK